MPPVNKQKNQTKNKTLRQIKHKVITKAEPPSNVKAPKIILEHPSLRKYWRKRYTLFSLFDKGIQLDHQGWFSVTPEKIAEQQALRMPCDVLIDGFCGCGGNAIQFAKTCNTVIAIDIDPAKVEMARYNAEIYGVAHKIKFIVGDFLELSESGNLQGDVVFLSPPWGGPAYKWVSEYDIETQLEPVGASELMRSASKVSSNIALFLPRNSNREQIQNLAGESMNHEVECHESDGRTVGLTALYGEYFFDQAEKKEKKKYI